MRSEKSWTERMWLHPQKTKIHCRHGRIITSSSIRQRIADVLLFAAMRRHSEYGICQKRLHSIWFKIGKFWFFPGPVTKSSSKCSRRGWRNRFAKLADQRQIGITKQNTNGKFKIYVIVGCCDVLQQSTVAKANDGTSQTWRWDSTRILGLFLGSKQCEVAFPKWVWMGIISYVVNTRWWREEKRKVIRNQNVPPKKCEKHSDLSKIFVRWAENERIHLSMNAMIYCTWLVEIET